MPGLLESSPYAGFDPKKDPFIMSQPNTLQAMQAMTGTHGDYFKGMAASIPGLIGDIGDPLLRLRQKLTGGGPQGAAPQTGLTSEYIGGLLGANTDTDAFKGGLLGAPDLGDLARMAPKGLLGMTLFHGTPHKFDKFDLGKIGTGEGAQAYGHGLYFAENPGVAKQYQAEVLNPRIYEINDELGKLSKQMSADEIGYRQYRNPETNKLAARYDELMDERANLKGHLYEVDIPDEITDKMLDYDRPFSKQPKEIKGALMDALRDVFKREGFLGPNDNGPRQFTSALKSYRIERGGFIDGDNGGSYYDLLAKALGSPEAASKKLNELGVPGIRFLDGGSRAANRGTRNIVVFNPDDIKQVKRDGELVYENKLGIGK